jgi:hypothetical protein
MTPGEVGDSHVERAIVEGFESAQAAAPSVSKAVYGGGEITESVILPC